MVEKTLVGKLSHPYSGQMERSMPPNILSEPQRSDLSINQKNWSLRPPGAAVLPVAGLLIGLSLGQLFNWAYFHVRLSGVMVGFFFSENFVSTNTSLSLLQFPTILRQDIDL